MVHFNSSPSLSVVVTACSLFEKLIALTTTSCSSSASSIEGVLDDGVKDDVLLMSPINTLAFISFSSRN
ncbi:hypothetical protein GOBAR_AA06479 [Gossypium barbadense]|uniref:Uncharacterized protein n=1 Tax=Gossypium barbadense TaxID=3634 RepID=A0A2P5YES6_GOSBA|nr:hypothetical protein GOBAR_AA06479 [Gossypium barbadense]